MLLFCVQGWTTWIIGRGSMLLFCLQGLATFGLRWRQNTIVCKGRQLWVCGWLCVWGQTTLGQWWREYVVVLCAGQGNFGSVKKGFCRLEDTEIPVAIKVLKNTDMGRAIQVHQGNLQQCFVVPNHDLSKSMYSTCHNQCIQLVQINVFNFSQSVYSACPNQCIQLVTISVFNLLQSVYSTCHNQCIQLVQMSVFNLSKSVHSCFGVALLSLSPKRTLCIISPQTSRGEYS